MTTLELINSPETQENYPRPLSQRFRLNLERWNALRLAVESRGMAGWYELAGSPGSPLPFWEPSALTAIGEGMASDRVSRLRSMAIESLDPGSKHRRMSPDEAQGTLALLDAALAGSVTKEQAHARWAADVTCQIETGRLKNPGRVFKAVDFKGGACSAVTWLYVLRAHFRKVPRLHLRRTLDEQAAMIEQALQEAPTLLAGLLDASAPSASDPSG